MIIVVAETPNYRTFKTISSMAMNSRTNSVHAPVNEASFKTEALLLEEVKRLNSTKSSLRKIAKRYGVSHGVIQRLLHGVFPVNTTIRNRLGLYETTKKYIPLNRIGTCAYQPCGQEFVKFAHNKKYCSRRCKDKNRREHAKN